MIAKGEEGMQRKVHCWSKKAEQQQGMLRSCANTLDTCV